MMAGEIFRVKNNALNHLTCTYVEEKTAVESLLMNFILGELEDSK